MKQRESYEIRLEMARMHDTYIEDLHEAMKEARYVEASWLCYAIIEQRVTRLILKHLDNCPLEKKKKDVPVSISTRLSCIKTLIENEYGGYAQMDKALFEEIEKWCKDRNELVHGLVSLEHYKHYDKEFEKLAKDGTPIVEKLYKEITKFREWYYRDGVFGDFPKFKCMCKKYRCIYEEK